MINTPQSCDHTLSHVITPYVLVQPLSCIHFECMMDKLEKGSGNTVLSDRDAQALLRDDEDLVLAVYEYWLGKRLRLVRGVGENMESLGQGYPSIVAPNCYWTFLGGVKWTIQSSWQ